VLPGVEAKGQSVKIYPSLLDGRAETTPTNWVQCDKQEERKGDKIPSLDNPSVDAD
jgi:hypothetical protein